MVGVSYGALYVLHFLFEDRQEPFGFWGAFGILVAYLFTGAFVFGFSNAFLTIFAELFKWKVTNKITNFWIGLCFIVPLVMILFSPQYFPLSLLLPGLKLSDYCLEWVYFLGSAC